MMPRHLSRCADRSVVPCLLALALAACGASADPKGGAAGGEPSAFTRSLPGEPNSIAVGPDGAIVVSGVYSKWDAPHADVPGDEGIFLASFAADGTPGFVRGFETSEDNLETNVAVGPDGSIALAGFFGRTGIAFGPPLAAVGADLTSFAALFERDGTLRWSRALGGNNNYFRGEVAFSPDGDVVLAGGFGEPLDFGTTTLQPNATGYDGYLVRLAPDGSERDAIVVGASVDGVVPTADGAWLALRVASPNPIGLARATWGGSIEVRTGFGKDVQDDAWISLVGGPAGTLQLTGFVGDADVGWNLPNGYGGFFWAKLDDSANVVATSDLPDATWLAAGQQHERTLAADARGHAFLLDSDQLGPRDGALLELAADGTTISRRPITGEANDDLTAVAAAPGGGAIVGGWSTSGGTFDGAPVEPGGFVRRVAR